MPGDKREEVVKCYFTEKLPNRSDVDTIDDLAVAYWSSTCIAQCRGIIHAVAQKGTEGPFSEGATAFLLGLASDEHRNEPNENLRKLALRLFVQRVLPKTVQMGGECLVFVARFFADEMERGQYLTPQERGNVWLFLEREWMASETSHTPITKDVLVAASVTTGSFGLLVDNKAFQAIPNLYHLLSDETAFGADPLECGLWHQLVGDDSLELLFSELRGSREVAKFEDDCNKISALCGCYMSGIVSDHSRAAAQALSSLLNILVAHRRYS